MEKLEKIKVLLESHVGKGNEVSAQVIEDEYGKSSDKTHRKARELIDACIEKYDLPVAANNKGYFIIANENDYDEYMANLDSRKAGIDERKSVITKIFKGEK